MSGTRSHMAWALIMITLFTLGLIKLLLLRFEAGDVYPKYSSLRSDPLGIQALFESINKVTPDSAVRNFRPLDQLAPDADQTILVCGMQANGYPMQSKRWQPLMEALAASGGRLVIAFNASVRRNEKTDERTCPADEAETRPEEDIKKDDTPNGPDATREASQWHGLSDLGIALKPSGKPSRQTGFAWRQTQDDPSDLPDTIVWRDALYFDLLDHHWQTIYARAGRPVVVTRQWGQATIVMAADSYLLSNEAMRNDRLPQLLVWLLGPGRTVIVDETHHGMIRQPGIAGLARKYRLHGVVAVLVLLVMLFIWQQIVVFLPRPVESHPATERAIGPDTAEGLILLMQHHVRSSDLLGVCYEAWQNSPAAGRFSETQIAEVRNTIRQFESGSGGSDPVGAYQHIHKLLTQGNNQWQTKHRC